MGTRDRIVLASPESDLPPASTLDDVRDARPHHSRNSGVSRQALVSPTAPKDRCGHRSIRRSGTSHAAGRPQNSQISRKSDDDWTASQFNGTALLQVKHEQLLKSEFTLQQRRLPLGKGERGAAYCQQHRRQRDRRVHAR